MGFLHSLLLLPRINSSPRTAASTKSVFTVAQAPEYIALGFFTALFSVSCLISIILHNYYAYVIFLVCLLLYFKKENLMIVLNQKCVQGSEDLRNFMMCFIYSILGCVCLPEFLESFIFP